MFALSPSFSLCHLPFDKRTLHFALSFTGPLKHFIPFWLFRSESVLFRYNLLVAASFFPFSLLLCSVLFVFFWFLFWCYKHRLRNNYSRDENICAYCYILTFFGFYYNGLSFHPSTSYFLFVIYVRPIYVYIQFASGGRGGWRFLLTWLPQLSCSIYLSLFLLSFLLIFSSHTDFAICLIVYTRFPSPSPLSHSPLSPPRFSTFSYLARFLITIRWPSLRIYDGRSTSPIPPIISAV